MGAIATQVGQGVSAVSARVRRAGTVLIILGCAWGAPLLLMVLGTIFITVPNSTTKEGASWQVVGAIVAGIGIVSIQLPRVLAGIAIHRGSRTARQVALVITSIWIVLGVVQAIAFLFVGLQTVSSVGWAAVLVTAFVSADLGASAWVVWALAKG